MKEFINKVEIRGIVGRAISQTFQGRSVVNFSVCVNSSSSSGGTLAIETTWFNVTYWQNSPDELVNKGDTVHVWGRFRMRKYVTLENEERTVYDIVADKVVIEDSTEE